MKDLLVRYVKYNVWANARVCDFLKHNLNEEQMNLEIISSFPSVMKTILHIWDAQYLWIKRLDGISLSSFPSKDFKGTSAEAMEGLMESSNQFVAFVESCSDEVLLKELTYKNVAGDEFTSKVNDILQHVMNHGTFHRGQIITMLRQLGYSKLFPTDYIAFCRE